MCLCVCVCSSVCICVYPFVCISSESRSSETNWSFDASPRGPADQCDEGPRAVDEERAIALDLVNGIHRIPMHKIGFLQASVSAKFRDGSSLEECVCQIDSGDLDPSTHPNFVLTATSSCFGSSCDECMCGRTGKSLFSCRQESTEATSEQAGGGA